MSKKTIQSTLSEQIGTIVAMPDQQSSHLEATETADESFVRHFNEHFAGMETLKNQEKIRAVTSLVNTLKTQQKKQLETVIAIGRAFLKTEEIFAKNEWDHLLEGTQKLFGMKKNMVSMYRAIARDIGNGRIPRTICPPSFSTAYQLTTFTDSQLEIALEQGIITPELTRQEAIAFKNEHKRSKRTTRKKKTPAQERRQLERLREKLYKELENVEKRLAHLSKN